MQRGLESIMPVTLIILAVACVAVSAGLTVVLYRADR